MTNIPARNEHVTRLQSRAERIQRNNVSGENPNPEIAELAAICAALCYQLNHMSNKVNSSRIQYVDARARQ